MFAVEENVTFSRAELPELAPPVVPDVPADAPLDAFATHNPENDGMSEPIRWIQAATAS